MDLEEIRKFGEEDYDHYEMLISKPEPGDFEEVVEVHNHKTTGTIWLACLEICGRLEEMTKALVLLQHRLKALESGRPQETQHPEWEPVPPPDHHSTTEPEHPEPEPREPVEEFVSGRGGRDIPIEDTPQSPEQPPEASH